MGEPITFTITVTNPGWADVWLNGTVYDKMLGTEWTFENLMPGFSEPFTATVDMPADMDEFVNTAYVEAFDHQLHMVTGTASVTVDIVHPDVEIEKLVDMTCAAVGETVTYTITVTNPESSDISISGTAYDDPLGWFESFFDLAPGESVHWDVPFVMVDTPTSDFWNLAHVVAYDPQDHLVEDSASVRVDVVHPDVEITKTSDKTCAAVAESVLYTITVTNPATADVWLNGSATDDDLKMTWPFSNLLPGQSAVFTTTVAMPAGVDEFINTASVRATDHQGHVVTDSDSVRVDVVHPEVLITKTADKSCAEAGELVTYTIIVTNPEWADVWLNGTVVDDALGWSYSFNDLKPGESLPFVIPVSMPDPEESEFLNIAEVIRDGPPRTSMYTRAPRGLWTSSTLTSRSRRPRTPAWCMSATRSRSP